MKQRLIYFILMIVFVSCKKDNPITAEQSQLPELPRVISSQLNYFEQDILSRVPDTTYKNKCSAMYKNILTDSSKKYAVNVLLQKAYLLNQDTSNVSKCLNATGQIKDGVI